MDNKGSYHRRPHATVSEKSEMCARFRQEEAETIQCDEEEEFIGFSDPEMSDDEHGGVPIPKKFSCKQDEDDGVVEPVVEESQTASVRKNLALKGDVNNLVDEACEDAGRPTSNRLFSGSTDFETHRKTDIQKVKGQRYLDLIAARWHLEWYHLVPRPIRPRKSDGRFLPVEDYSKNLLKNLAVLSYYVSVGKAAERLLKHVETRMADFRGSMQGKSFSTNDVKRVLLQWKEKAVISIIQVIQALASSLSD